jgi:hypothetical protein
MNSRSFFPNYSYSLHASGRQACPSPISKGGGIVIKFYSFHLIRTVIKSSLPSVKGRDGDGFGCHWTFSNKTPDSFYFTEIFRRFLFG